MKTLVINGSPRRKGDTSYLVHLINKKLRGEVDIINVYDFGFNPCIDCRACLDNKACIFDDEMSDLIDNIERYDNIIIATPLYYNQPTGELLSLMSRNQIIFNQGRKLRGKRGGVIVVGGGDSIVNSSDAEKTIRIMLKSYNVNVIAYARSLHTSTLPAKSDLVAINEVCNMIGKLNNEIE